MDDLYGLCVLMELSCIRRGWENLWPVREWSPLDKVRAGVGAVSWDWGDKLGKPHRGNHCKNTKLSDTVTPYHLVEGGVYNKYIWQNSVYFLKKSLHSPRCCSKQIEFYCWRFRGAKAVIPGLVGGSCIWLISSLAYGENFVIRLSQSWNLFPWTPTSSCEKQRLSALVAYED